MSIWQEWTANHTIHRKTTKNEDEEHEYDNDNGEDIYNGEIDQGELGGILEDTERNPNPHKD